MAIVKICPVAPKCLTCLKIYATLCAETAHRRLFPVQDRYREHQVLAPPFYQNEVRTEWVTKSRMDRRRAK
ncbi:MAG: hypothetical protein Kow0099_36900 [Candidatus Abyssubacteria bacterium]